MNSSVRLIAPASISDFGIDNNQWQILVDVIYPDAKESSSIMKVLSYCKARNLDIFKKPVYIVPMWNASSGSMVETVYPGINEIQITASRSNLWAGLDSPKFGNFITKVFTDDIYDEKLNSMIEKSVELVFPEWCEVTVYRIVDGKKSSFTEPVFWEESYATIGNSIVPNFIWQKRARSQLMKCAKAASLRAAFPEECGDYAAEEMSGKVLNQDFNAVLKSVPSNISSAETSNLIYTDDEISDETKVFVEKVIVRAINQNSWAAASAYLEERLNGIDLSYSKHMMNNAILKSTPSPTSSSDNSAETNDSSLAPKATEQLPTYSENEVSDKVKLYVKQIIDRAVSKNAFNQALLYFQEKLTGIDLMYAKDSLEKQSLSTSV